MPVPRKNTRNTRGRIISAAWKLFYEQGYEDTTVEDIVFESETSKGSFYHYFDGKDALLGTLAYVFDEKYEELYPALDPAMDAVEKLQETYGCPAVIVGDLNTWPAGKAVQAALARGYVHGHDAATQYADESRGMHRCDATGYDTFILEGGFGKSLEHILMKGAVSVSRFERYCPEDFYPLSDHSPAFIDAEF